MQISVSGNSAFDPLASSGTNQPVGFDYWAAMYERYRVIGSRCRVVATLVGTAVGGGVAGAASLTTVLYPSNATGSLVSMSDAISQPLSKNTDATSAQRGVLQSAISTAKITGIKDVEGADQLQATIGSNPANEWYWNIGHETGAAYADTSVNIDICITYDVEFYDRAQLNRSTLVWGHINKAYQAHCAELLQRQQTAQSRRGFFPPQESKEDSKGGYVHVETDIEDSYPALIRGPMLQSTKPSTTLSLARSAQAAPPPTPNKGFGK